MMMILTDVYGVGIEDNILGDIAANNLYLNILLLVLFIYLERRGRFYLNAIDTFSIGVVDDVLRKSPIADKVVINTACVTPSFGRRGGGGVI